MESKFITVYEYIVNDGDDIEKSKNFFKSMKLKKTMWTYPVNDIVCIGEMPNHEDADGNPVFEMKVSKFGTSSCTSYISKNTAEKILEVINSKIIEG